MVFGKHFYKYYFRYLHTFILGALALVLVDLFQLEIPEIVGQIIDAIKEQNLSKELLLEYVSLVMVVKLKQILEIKCLDIWKRCRKHIFLTIKLVH